MRSWPGGAARGGGRILGQSRSRCGGPGNRRRRGDRRRWSGRLCRGSFGIAGRADRRPDRGDRLDRRPAHLAGRAARRASVGRDVRRECFLPGTAAGDPRLLPPPLPDDRRGARSSIAQPRQWRRVETLSRAAGRAGGLDGHAGPICLQRPAAVPARARAGQGRRAGRPRARGDRPRRPDRSGAIPGRPLFPRRDRAGRPAADGRRRVRHRGRVAGLAPASRTPPVRISPPISRRSPAASPSSTATARTTPSIDPPNTPSGATSSPS